MSGRLLEIAVRPIRIAFLLGLNPSHRLLNSVISVNSGMWGGIYNFICPTDGSAIADDYLECLKNYSPDCIALCGKFKNRQNIINRLGAHNIYPAFLYRRAAVGNLWKRGVGIEGIFDRRFLQSIQRGSFGETAIVNPHLTRATIFDKVKFGIPPYRLIKYIEDRVDFITVTHYKKESRRGESDYGEPIGVIQITGENIEEKRLGRGRRSVMPLYRFGRLYYVVGDEDRLEDSCYFWNLRAIFGVDRVRWIALGDLASFLSRPELARASILTLTSAPGRSGEGIKDILKESKNTHVHYYQPRDVLRMRANLVWESELRSEHIAADDGELVIPVSKPSFELVNLQRNSGWVMDLRLIRDDLIGTEGFVLPSLTYLSNMVTPGRSARLQPRVQGDTLSLQISSARSDEHIRLRVPRDWEVIQTIFAHGGYKVCLSDQGNYMSRALALFGGLARLSKLLRDPRVTTIFNEFVKHHRSSARVAEDDRYRRALTLDDMRKIVASLMSHRSRRRKEDDFRFIDELLKELIRLGAVHSGYVLDCSKCSLEDWYPIDEVAEHFRCRRCLANEIRPLSPPVSFRLNEALYQAYLHNFAVPVLLLDVLQKSTTTSFIFSPQIKLDERNLHSNEIDIVAVCDGNLTLGEAKSTDKIKKEQIDCLESTALKVSANRIVLGTTSRDSCKHIYCAQCSDNKHYADNAFTQGSTQDSKSWGTREHIVDLRSRLSTHGIQVTSICAEDINYGGMERNRSRWNFVPTRRPY